MKAVIKSPLRGHPFYELFDSSAYIDLRDSYDGLCQLNGSGWLCYNMNPVQESAVMIWHFCFVHHIDKQRKPKHVS